LMRIVRCSTSSAASARLMLWSKSSSTTSTV
jgi:hypothetical protein